MPGVKCSIKYKEEREAICNKILEIVGTESIEEFNLDVDSLHNTDTVHLKEKTEVYYQMYREARQKAKLAKFLALSSYMEAKRIKNLYMLDDIESSDDEYEFLMCDFTRIITMSINIYRHGSKIKEKTQNKKTPQ